MDRAELQAVQLALAFGLGLGLGFFYDFYRVWFRQLKGRLWPALGDIVWWLAALGLAFAGLYHINGAQLRLPVLLLAAAGVCLYLGFFSPVLFPLLRRLLLGLWRLLRWLLGCFARAVALLLSPLVWLVELAFRLLWLLQRLLILPYRWLLRPAGRLLCRLFNSLLARPWQKLHTYLRKAFKKRIKKVDFEGGNDI